MACLKIIPKMLPRIKPIGLAIHLAGPKKPIITMHGKAGAGKTHNGGSPILDLPTVSPAARHLSCDSFLLMVVLTGTGKGFCSGGRVDEINRPLMQSNYRAYELLFFSRIICHPLVAPQ